MQSIAPGRNRDYVDVHAKLMIVDDVFTTLGSVSSFDSS
jgi:phosphatidylserine/phosphatidylglycerophosphate/cardiolipin synthase-like enzyme